MFSRTVEYALRTAVLLADCAPDMRTTRQIAAATQVPAPYLAKVIQALQRAGLLIAQRGVGGGVCLAKPPAEMTILEVVQAVDPIHRIDRCPLGLVSHGMRLCALHRRLDNALALVEEAFGSTTLADVLAEPSDSVPLCEFAGIPPIPVTIKPPSTGA